MPRFTTRTRPSSKRSTTFFPRRPTSRIAWPRSPAPSRRAVSPGARTSGFATSTRVTVLPTTRPRRSRAIVSASGSSGTALQLPPADVAAVVLALELDGRGRRPAALGGLRQRASDAGHREHAPAPRHQPPVLAPRAGVEDDGALRPIHPRRDADLLALLVCARVAGGGEHRGERRARPPGERRAGDGLASRDREHRLQQ